MNLFKSESDRYSQEQLSAREAQRQAEFIAWGPVIFQVSRLMLKWGILEEIRNSHDGLTLECWYHTDRQGFRPLYDFEDGVVSAHGCCYPGKYRLQS